MSGSDSSPLDETHLAMLRQAKEALKDASIQLDRASRAGIDVSPHRATVTTLQQKVKQLMDGYFPGQL